MKKLLLNICCIITASLLYGQDITGQWNGLLKVPGIQLSLVFHISKTDSGYSAIMDSPDQGAKGIPVNTLTYENSVLKLAITKAGIEYEGALNKANIFSGNFKQAGQVFPLSLSREMVEKKKILRPQEPVKPYPYHTEEIQFENKQAHITLAGTLSFPNKEGMFPAVVLITGSGPQNRDEELLGHKPFLVLSDHLTRNGIAVLRFDDRGTAASKGNFKTATSADFATDVESAVQYLATRKEINKTKIGLIGHSEGGIIAPMVAARSAEISFIVLLAGTGITGDKILLLQQELIGKASGERDDELQKTKRINKGAFDIVSSAVDTVKLKTDLTNYLKLALKENPAANKPGGMSDDAFIQLQVSQLTSPWMKYFISYDPAVNLEKVKCPVLAINGEKDLQVPPEINLASIKRALEKAGNKNVTVKELPGLNHLFQECKTGSPDEYAEIEQTISPIALATITTWILEIVK